MLGLGPLEPFGVAPVLDQISGRNGQPVKSVYTPTWRSSFLRPAVPAAARALHESKSVYSPPVQGEPSDRTEPTDLTSGDRAPLYGVPPRGGTCTRGLSAAAEPRRGHQRLRRRCASGAKNQRQKKDLQIMAALLPPKTDTKRPRCRAFCVSDKSEISDMATIHSPLKW